MNFDWFIRQSYGLQALNRVQEMIIGVISELGKYNFKEF